MADLIGAIVIAAGTVVAACINAAGIRSQLKSGAQKSRQTGKPKKRRNVPATSNRSQRRPS